jgi:hypothetical protein
VGDYTDSKGGPGNVFLDGSEPDSAGGWSRVAPLITPEQVRRKHLFGVDLVSGTMNSITEKRDVLTLDDIADKIDDAVATVELETGVVILPTQITEKIPFDLHLYRSWGYTRLKKRPVASVEAFDVVLANDTTTYTIPLDWVDTGQLHQGQLNLIPLTIALQKQGSQIPTSAAASAVVLTLLVHQTWVPSFWQVKYTAGFPSGQVPKVLNDLIGTVVAMEILSELATTYAKNSSGSLSIDGLSQSVSTPGPEIFTRRLTDLDKKRTTLTKKIKTHFGLNFFSGEV